MNKIQYPERFNYEGMGYVRLPKKLIATLKPNEALLYSIMADDFWFYMKHKGMYKPSDNKLAEKLGCSRGAVIRARESLEVKGYIKVISKRSNCSTIWHVNDIDKSGKPIIADPIITEPMKILLAKGLDNDEAANKETTTAVCNELNKPEHRAIRISDNERRVSDYDLEGGRAFGSSREYEESPF